MSRHGLVFVYTGQGKGKTTAALGLLLRSWGHGRRACVIQFIKRETGNWGEVRAARRMNNVEWVKTGDGFTKRSKDMEESAALARHGWHLAQEKIAGGDYDLVVLDEFTYPLAYGWLDLGRVIEWLRANRPAGQHVVITGRRAPEELIEFADLVTEMRNIKHPHQRGVKAQAGVEF